MCLYQKLEVPKKLRDKAEFVVYKVVLRSNRGRADEFFSPWRQERITLSQSVTADDTPLPYDFYDFEDHGIKYYRSGYHVFTSRRQARMYRRIIRWSSPTRNGPAILRGIASELRAYGVDNGLPTAVVGRVRWERVVR